MGQDPPSPLAYICSLGRDLHRGEAYSLSSPLCRSLPALSLVEDCRCPLYCRIVCCCYVVLLIVVDIVVDYSCCLFFVVVCMSDRCLLIVVCPVGIVDDVCYCSYS